MKYYATPFFSRILNSIILYKRQILINAKNIYSIFLINSIFDNKALNNIVNVDKCLENTLVELR